MTENRRTKRQVWEEIQEFNDEFFWSIARGLTLADLEAYLSALKEFRVSPRKSKRVLDK